MASIDQKLDDVIGKRLGLILTDDETHQYHNHQAKIVWKASVRVKPELEPEESNFAVQTMKTAILFFSAVVYVVQMCNRVVSRLYNVIRPSHNSQTWAK